MVSFSQKNSNELPFIIEKLSKDYDVVSIVGSDEDFAIAAKSVATLTGGSLELKDSTTLALISASVVLSFSSSEPPVSVATLFAAMAKSSSEPTMLTTS